jgi:3-oxoacyl-[acyl-carrier protein] reductase
MKAIRAVVTGAASPKGIGSRVARRLAERGAHVIVMDLDRRVAATADDLRRAFPEQTFEAIEVDIADSTSVTSGIQQSVASMGGLDVVVHSAGIAGVEVDLVDVSDEDFDRIVSTNLRGTFLMLREAGRVMKDAGKGCIVTISSIFGIEPEVKTAVYSASKAGVVSLTHGLARELGPFGIRVNCIAPGYIATEMLEEKQLERADRHGLDLAEERQRIDGAIPLRRHGIPDDVAGAVIYLVSEEASYVTGWTLGVAGGVVMR